MKKTTKLLTAALLAATLTSCGAKAELLTPGAASPVYSKVDENALSDFSLKLFQTAYEEGKNTMISPLSVAYALGMTSLGASGETLSQMEELFGLDRKTLAESLSSVAATLSAANDNKNKTILADSVWIRNYDFTPDEDFLDAVKNSYAADIFTAPFDSSTRDEINSWIRKNTEGTIKKVLDEIPEDAVMYLVNTLFFEAEWENVYKSTDVYDGKFTSFDGEISDVKMMSSEENTYLKGEGFTGFVKYYKGRKFGFAAILPDEGKTPGEVISSLDGAALTKLLSECDRGGLVSAATPKFESEYEAEMSDILIKLGMTDAFDSDLADFSGIGKSPRGTIFINRVLHKTFIEVAEKGTKAGAATVVEMFDECALEEVREVILDRPFAYVIFETTDYVPLFIGTYENLK